MNSRCGPYADGMDLAFPDWFDYGRERGWISAAFCLTHDTGLTDEELEEEHCVPGLRITADLDEPEFGRDL